MNKLILKIPIMLLCISAVCSCKPGPENLVKQNFDFAQNQISYALQQMDSIRNANFSIVTDKDTTASRLMNPRSLSPNGSLNQVPSSDWCSGFFPGELWFLYEYTGQDKWKELAKERTVILDQEKYNDRTHDMGFKLFCSYGNGYRLTKDTMYRNVLIHAARTLITRYNPAVGCIRSWDFGTEKWKFPVIIDNMLNLELLFWAARETGDSTFYKVALTHAETTLKNHFRPDYSCFHVVDYDPQTGKVRSKGTHQGYSDSSSWARGQAWALYGYTMCYRETKRVEFLKQAEHVAQFILKNKNLPQDKIPYWDYNAPAIPDEPRDVSAAACTASALYELSTFSSQGSYFREQANLIVENLSKSYRAAQNTHKGFLLLHSTGSKPGNLEVDVPLVYADYYFLEALLRKENLNN